MFLNPETVHIRRLIFVKTSRKLTMVDKVTKNLEISLIPSYADSGILINGLKPWVE